MIGTLTNKMVNIERDRYRLGTDTAEFEVGLTHLEPGWNFVVNPGNGQLEQIYGVETGTYECRDAFTRVETYPGQWYEVDGVTRFARLCTALDKTAGVDLKVPQLA